MTASRTCTSSTVVDEGMDPSSPNCVVSLKTSSQVILRLLVRPQSQQQGTLRWSEGAFGLESGLSALSLSPVWRLMMVVLEVSVTRVQPDSTRCAWEKPHRAAALLQV
ncbi:hypothetical protein SKAU_G00323390 [Synaphobranchus kaupii]|uniref:Uncharacterized protein n=1 Tax=Synaphobranchus kaupii TaxID=118154 RepID=A0A9Q1EP98_SYNKA|nr:hypothetical protein SKAU_G00323390 [Synaphobranchus kaupii]